MTEIQIFNFFNTPYVHLWWQTKSSLAWGIPVLHTFLERCSAILHRQFLAARFWRGCVALPFSLKYPKGVLLDSSQDTCLAGHSFFACRNPCMILAKCFGLLSCWHISLLPSFWRLGVILSACILVYSQAFMVPSINVISSTPFALMQPCVIILPPLCFTFGTMHSPGQVHAKHAGPHLSQAVYLGLIWQ